MLSWILMLQKRFLEMLKDGVIFKDTVIMDGRKCQSSEIKIRWYLELAGELFAGKLGEVSKAGSGRRAGTATFPPCWFAWAALTKCHIPLTGCLNNKSLCSHSSGCLKSKIKTWAGLVSSLSLACRWPPPHCILSWLSSCAHASLMSLSVPIFPLLTGTPVRLH